MPPEHEVVIAHGDYRFGNCLTDAATGRIAAVLDWELCTLGDPLADVGYLAVYWTDPGTPGRRHNDPSGAPGFPTYSELLEHYAARTGRDVSAIDFYVAFASWRLAVISEGCTPATSTERWATRGSVPPSWRSSRTAPIAGRGCLRRRYSARVIV